MTKATTDWNEISLVLKVNTGTTTTPNYIDYVLIGGVNNNFAPYSYSAGIAGGNAEKAYAYDPTSKYGEGITTYGGRQLNSLSFKDLSFTLISIRTQVYLYIADPTDSTLIGYCLLPDFTHEMMSNGNTVRWWSPTLYGQAGSGVNPAAIAAASPSDTLYVILNSNNDILNSSSKPTLTIPVPKEGEYPWDNTKYFAMDRLHRGDDQYYSQS